MFKHIIIAGIVFATVGCSSVSGYLASPTAQLQLNQQPAASVLQLQALALENGKASAIQIQSDSQKINLPNVNSPVALYKIPTNGQELTLQVASYFDRTFFAPSVMLFDDQGNQLVNIPNDEFSFQDKDFLQSYRQQFERPIIPPSETDALYVLIYTTEENVKDSTQIWVKVEGFNDELVTIEHAYNGRVAVKYTQAEKEDLSNLTLSNPLQTPGQDKPTNPVVNLPTESQSKSSSENMSKDVMDPTANTSMDELRALIQQGDTEQALQLLNQMDKTQ